MSKRAGALTQPLKYHGGKGPIAPKIVALMPRHCHYCEPFAGGLAVLLARDPLDQRLWLPPHKGVSEVVNDLNGELTRFWQVMRDGDLFARFHRAVEATPFSEVEYRDAGIAPELWLSEPTPEGQIAARMVALAWCFFVRCRLSLAGRMDSFTGVTKTRVRRGMNNEVSAWLSCVEGLPAVHERLKRVLVLNRDALDVIRGQDGIGVLHYCDPPYVRDTRTAPDVYAHEMSDEKHRELIDLLLTVKGKVMLSGYHHPLYDALHEKHGWRLVEWDCPNNAAGGTTKKRMTEALWMNWLL